MPYTNVYLAGTSVGTMAFTDGYYIIRGLRPGTYTVKASYISYGGGIATVTLEPGQVVILDFRLRAPGDPGRRRRGGGGARADRAGAHRVEPLHVVAPARGDAAGPDGRHDRPAAGRHHAGQRDPHPRRPGRRHPVPGRRRLGGRSPVRRRLRLPDRPLDHQRDRGAHRRLQRRVRPGRLRRRQRDHQGRRRPARGPGEPAPRLPASNRAQGRSDRLAGSVQLRRAAEHRRREALGQRTGSDLARPARHRPEPARHAVRAGQRLDGRPRRLPAHLLAAGPAVVAAVSRRASGRRGRTTTGTACSSGPGTPRRRAS